VSEGKILYAMQDETCFLRLVGEIRYDRSVAFDEFIDRLFDEKRPSWVLIDMTDTTLIDSTNLGLLAKIAKRLLSSRNHRPTIFSTDDDITMLLRNIGFDDVFDVVEDEKAAPPELRQVPGITPGKSAQARTMLEAHRELMALNEKNRDVFKDVVGMMEKDVERSAVEHEVR